MPCKPAAKEWLLNRYGAAGPREAAFNAPKTYNSSGGNCHSESVLSFDHG
jgi:hypothetical protein